MNIGQMREPQPHDVTTAALALAALSAVGAARRRATPPSEQLDNAVTAAYVFAGLLRDPSLAPQRPG